MNKIYKLLSEHKSTMIGDVSDDYKCCICKKILINAHQVTCGCNFCHECINQHIANGAICCPGNTEECQFENLSNISTNHGLNKQISKLIVKCPSKMCSHECQLIEMEEHMRFCSSKSMKCPFNDVGCEHDDVANDKLNEHLLLDIHNHNKILIDLIGNLKNEVTELKNREERNRLEIEILKENDRKKDERIESLKEEIKLIKKENEDLAQQMESGNRNLWHKLDEIDMEINEKCKNDSIKSINDDIKMMRMEKEELAQQMKREMKRNSDEKINVEMDARLCEMREEWSEKLEKTIKKMKEESEKCQMEITTEVNQIDKFLNMRDDGILIMQINKINEIELMSSGFFYDRKNPYKMQLVLINENDGFGVFLFIHSGAFDADLKWPCQANITIEIFALHDTNKKKSLTKLCKVEKPENDSIQSSDDAIRFSHSDLRSVQLMRRNCVMACFVKFDNLLENDMTK